LQNVVDFSSLSDCTSEPKIIAVTYDSNVSGVYVVDLNYGGIYNGKPLWCSSIKSFEAEFCEDTQTSIPDSSMLSLLLLLSIVIMIFVLEKNNTLKKKKQK
jgi:hypothetical protein